MRHVVAVASYFIEDVTLPSITLWSTKSANGTMTAPGSIVVGESGDFVVDLKDVTEFAIYDVKEVQIIKHNGIGSALTTQVAATLVPSSDGQTQFTWQWSPTAADVGDQTFSVFVVTEESPATPVEIADDSKRTVAVTDPVFEETISTSVEVSVSRRNSAEACRDSSETGGMCTIQFTSPTVRLRVQASASPNSGSISFSLPAADGPVFDVFISAGGYTSIERLWSGPITVGLTVSAPGSFPFTTSRGTATTEVEYSVRLETDGGTREGSGIWEGFNNGQGMRSYEWSSSEEFNGGSDSFTVTAELPSDMPSTFDIGWDLDVNVQLAGDEERAVSGAFNVVVSY